MRQYIFAVLAFILGACAPAQSAEERRQPVVTPLEDAPIAGPLRPQRQSYRMDRLLPEICRNLNWALIWDALANPSLPLNKGGEHLDEKVWASGLREQLSYYLAPLPEWYHPGNAALVFASIPRDELLENATRELDEDPGGDPEFIAASSVEHRGRTYLRFAYIMTSTIESVAADLGCN